MEGYPPEMHAAVIYRLAEAKIAHVRLLRARSCGTKTCSLSRPCYFPSGFSGHFGER
jgi:hypothetical protein